ncbi:hypothetical protein HY745_02675 [Candidatus Desantisbacteria bacterium]|nr:hypothetical protein [Candidatus Desantisbacteria bacterium]
MRKKFLKTVNTELSYIINMVIQYMLAFPDIAFVLAHNNRILYNFPITKNIEERIYEIYGLDIKNSLLQLDYKVDNIELHIYGFISNPSYSKPNKNYQIIFVNKRAVRNKTISHAIYEGYRSFLMVDRHPMAIIHIDINSKFVDVNIHPAKKEVKFTDDKIIHNSVSNAISEALKSGCNNKTFLINEKHFENININELPQSYHANAIKPESDIKFEYSLLKDEIKGESIYKLPSLNPLVQIKNTYWIAENNNKYYILDQHAFHERILFEKIILSIKKYEIRFFNKNCYNHGMSWCY